VIEQQVAATVYNLAAVAVVVGLGALVGTAVAAYLRVRGYWRDDR
jgi:hypothetical protein